MLDSNGFDAFSITAGIYSPATLHQIYGGKSFKRGIEYHITYSLACLMLKFDAVLPEIPGPLKRECNNLKVFNRQAKRKSDPIKRTIQAVF